MRTLRTGVLTMTAVVAVTRLWAADVSQSRDPQALTRAMEKRAKQLTEAARSTKGGPQQELLLKRAQLKSLLERLEKGEQVDPAEVDRLLAH